MIGHLGSSVAFPDTTHTDPKSDSLLDHIKPDVVHIMHDGRIIKTGGPELALEVENEGYSHLIEEEA